MVKGKMSLNFHSKPECHHKMLTSHATGYHWSLKVFSCTLVLLLSNTLVICQDITLGDTIFGSSPSTDRIIDSNDKEVTTPSTYNSFKDVVSHLGGCRCIPVYQCDDKIFNKDGTGIIDIRLKRETCVHFIDECCYNPISTENTPPVKPVERQRCGKRNVDGMGFRIAGNVDNEAQFGEFPWMIAIYVETGIANNTMQYKYNCGGSLIHEQVVLTAAHCVRARNPSTLKARAGEWDTQNEDEIFGHQDRYVVKKITHEKYNAGSLRNDIALLVMERPFELSDNVDIICLPLQGSELLHNECLASGWGKDEFGIEGKYQSILKMVELPMVPRDKCTAELRKTRLGPRFNLDVSFVCAGGIPGKDTCKGDGGSPLVCLIPGTDFQYQQVGIVSWGVDCGKGTPALYANVALFRDWIDNQMKMLNLRF